MLANETYLEKVRRKLEKKQRVIRVAGGAEKADLVLKNATYLNVFSNEFCHGDIAVAEGLIVGMGKFLNSSTEKMLMLQTDLNLATSETIGTYTYKIGLVKRQYGYSAAVDLFTNVINFSTLLIVNFVSKHVSNSSLF